MEDKWQPESVANQLVDEAQRDEKLWSLILERYQETLMFEEISKNIQKRWDLEPEAFPARIRPTASEAMAVFLEEKYSKPFCLLNTQLAMQASIRIHLNLKKEV